MATPSGICQGGAILPADGPRSIALAGDGINDWGSHGRTEYVPWTDVMHEAAPALASPEGVS